MPGNVDKKLCLEAIDTIIKHLETKEYNLNHPFVLEAFVLTERLMHPFDHKTEQHASNIAWKFLFANSRLQSPQHVYSTLILHFPELFVGIYGATSSQESPFDCSKLVDLNAILASKLQTLNHTNHVSPIKARYQCVHKCLDSYLKIISQQNDKNQENTRLYKLVEHCELTPLDIDQLKRINFILIFSNIAFKFDTYWELKWQVKQIQCLDSADESLKLLHSATSQEVYDSNLMLVIEKLCALSAVSDNPTLTEQLQAWQNHSLFQESMAPNPPSLGISTSSLRITQEHTSWLMALHTKIKNCLDNYINNQNNNYKNSWLLQAQVFQCLLQAPTLTQEQLAKTIARQHCPESLQHLDDNQLFRQSGRYARIYHSIKQYQFVDKIRVSIVLYNTNITTLPIQASLHLIHAAQIFTEQCRSEMDNLLGKAYLNNILTGSSLKEQFEHIIQQGQIDITEKVKSIMTTSLYNRTIYSPLPATTTETIQFQYHLNQQDQGQSLPRGTTVQTRPLCLKT